MKRCITWQRIFVTEFSEKTDVGLGKSDEQSKAIVLSVKSFRIEASTNVTKIEEPEPVV